MISEKECIPKSSEARIDASKMEEELKQRVTPIFRLEIGARKRDKLAKTLGVSSRHILNRLNLLYLPEAIQIMLDNEKIYIKEAEMLNKLREVMPIRKKSLGKGLTKEQLQAKESEFWEEIHAKMIEGFEYILRGEPGDRSKRNMKLPDLKIKIKSLIQAIEDEAAAQESLIDSLREKLNEEREILIEKLSALQTKALKETIEFANDPYFKKLDKLLLDDSMSLEELLEQEKKKKLILS